MQLGVKSLFLLAVVLYGISTLYSIFLLRQGFRQDTRVNYFLLFAGACFHTWAMFVRGFSLDRCPINNLFEATIFIAWTIVTSYLVIGAWSRVRFLGAFASPLLFAIGVFALMPKLDPPYEASHPNFSGGIYSLHAALILLSAGAFGLSSIAAVMYLTQDRNLKQDKLAAVLSRLPSIQRLEQITWRLMIAGQALLTFGLVSGAFWLKERHGVYWKWDSTIIWTATVWFIYLIILTLHQLHKQRGRKFAWGAVAGFIFVFLTFWGFYLLSDLHKASPPTAAHF